MSVITTNTAKLLGTKLRNRNKALKGAGGENLRVAGEVQVQLGKGNLIMTSTLVVVEGAKTNLLGRPEIAHLKLIDVVNNVKVEDRYDDMYNGLGTLPETFRIQMKADARPVCLQIPRKLPMGLREATKKELDRMLHMEVIEKVEEPREWCSGMVVAPKANGQVRICVDLTALNKSVHRENYPLPRVEELLAGLEGSNIFSKMDANSGFWQINLHPESRKLTTFITPFGRFQFKKMPFGISAAPEFFQRQMGRIIEGLEGVLCMMDNILVFGKNEIEHDKRPDAVFEKFRQARLTLNKEKCEFRMNQVKFLGHVVSRKGIQIKSSSKAF